MLHAFSKPAHDEAGSKISYKAPLHHLGRFGYTHDSTTLWRIWDPNFQVVQAQSEVIFDEEWNAYVSCTTDGIDIFGLPEDAEYIEELHT
jgi:hypothetical protein